MRTLIYSLVAAILLTSCGRGDQTVQGARGVVEPTVQFVEWASIPIDQIIIPEGVSYTIGDGTARITGVPLNAGAGGSTGGLGLRLADSFEANASGKQVRVTVRASSADEGALLGVAYSTADVGNSGWQAFPLTTEPADYTFTYDVPLLQAGNGDYLGFRSYGDDIVSVYGYSVTVVEPAPAPAAP